MAGGDVVMTPGNDLASQRGFSWDINSSVIMKEAAFLGDASVVSKGGGDANVPELLLSGSFLDLSVYCVSRRHDERSKVCRLKNGDVMVIFLALVMVVASGQEICFLIEGARFVS